MMINSKKNLSIAVLGSTGSIGTQALEVARHLNLKVAAISAGSNIALAENQIREFSPKICAVRDEKAAEKLKLEFKLIINGQQLI